jgi:hypothetical protein
VSGLTTGKNYHCHVKATNAIGDSAYSDFGTTVLTAQGPGAPTVTGTLASPGAVSVEFTPGPANGSPITGYTTECVSTDGGATKTATGVASPISVSGLTAGKNYHCRVKATNAVADGGYSPFGPTVFVPQAPAPPTITGSAPTLSAITVTFAPADPGGSPVTGYTAECASTDGGGTNTVTASTSPITVTGLTPTKHYRCRVKASNAVGDSPYSDPGPEVLVPTLPGKPAITKSKAKSPTSLKAVIRLLDTGGSAVLSYTVACKSRDGGDKGTATGATNTVTVKKLTPGKTYRCKAQARTAAGPSPWSPKGAKTNLPAHARIPATRASPAWF